MSDLCDCGAVDQMHDGGCAIFDAAWSARSTSEAVETLLRIGSEPFRLALAGALHEQGAPLLRSDKVAMALRRAALEIEEAGK